MPASNHNRTYRQEKNDNPVFRQLSPKTFYSLIEKSSDIITILDCRGVIKYISPSIKAIYGMDPEALVGRSVFSMVHDEDLAEAQNIFSEMLSVPGSVGKFENRLMLDDNRMVWTEGYCTNLLHDKDIEGIVGNFRDITERKKVEEKLFISREKFRLLAENSEDIIARYDRDLKHIYVNKALGDIMNIPQEQFIGKTNAEMGVPPDMVELWETNLKQVFATGKRQELSFTFDLPSGVKFFQSFIIPEYSSDGKVSSALCNTRDLTSIKQKEDALEIVNNELKTFLYKTSHDLRGPITTIQGLVLVAREDRENMDEYLDCIFATTRKLDKTLESLRKIVTIKKKEISPSMIDFSVLISKTLKELEILEGFEKINFNIHIENYNSKFISDANLISLILYNLLDNSIRYRDDKKDITEVRVEVKQENDNVILEVQDSGIGIDDEIKDKIFKMFYRGNVRSTGAGLGLYMVKDTLDLLKGSIDLFRENGKTKFKVTLPAMKIN